MASIFGSKCKSFMTMSISPRVDQSASGKLRDKNVEESWALLEDLILYDNESWNNPRDFTKLVQRLMESHLAPNSSVQVNKFASSCKICSGPHNIQYCMENPEQAFVIYASLRTTKQELFLPRLRDVSTPVQDYCLRQEMTIAAIAIQATLAVKVRGSSVSGTRYGLKTILYSRTSYVLSTMILCERCTPVSTCREPYILYDEMIYSRYLQTSSRTTMKNLMNELTRNNLQVTTMQVNVQFLQQLQPEWSRFVTVVKQSKEIDTISYHTLFDILKQYQNEVNDIRAERIAKSANPLALLAAAQPYSDNYYQAPKPQRTNTTSSSTRPSASTRHKGKEIAKPVTPQSESVSEEDSDPEQAQRDKDMQKNLALLAKYFKKLYKPTNNNLRTSSNSRNKTEDTTPRKPKRVKDYTYHKEKMMMCKQAEHGVPLQAEQADWLADTDEEIDEQELEAHYSFMAKIQEVLPEESSSTDQPLEHIQNHDENNKDDSNVTPDSSNICNNDNQVDQNAAECVDECAALANLIANLTLDTEENKTILKQLKKANASLTQELKKCRTNLDETCRALGEATSCQDSCLIALQNKQNEFEKYKAFNDRTIDYDILQTKLNKTLGLLARKDIDIKKGLKTKAYEILVVNQKHDELVKKSLLTKSQFEGQLKEKSKVISDLKVKEGRDIDKMIEMDKQIKSTFANPKYLKIAEKPCLYEIPYDTSDPANRFCPNREDTVTLEKEKMHEDFEYVESLEKEIDELESEKADFSNIYDLLLEECCSKRCHMFIFAFSVDLNGSYWNYNVISSQEQMKNNSVCKENGSNVFRKEREQYHEIQDLKAQMQDKNIAISELKKLIEKCKGKSVETQFDKPSDVRQLNAQRILKPSVLGKLTPFSNSPEMRSFQTKQSVNKTNVSDGSSKQVTQQNLP
ncbi:hypothetical protein Tco_0411069 [Tanacetum coccineum]